MASKLIQRTGKMKRLRVGIFALILLLLPAHAYLDEVQYTYDALGRLVGVTNSDGETAIYTYDAVGNLLSITRATAGQVAIITFSPAKGTEGTPVTVTGQGFSANPGDNQVTFGGSVLAVVTDSTPTTIETSVPAGAVTGPISVVTPLGSAISLNSFEVLIINPPVVTGIAPILGQQGQTINLFTLYGTHLENATDVSFIPPDGITVGNPPFFEADGTSATVQISISPTAVTGGRVAVITTPDGTSETAMASANTFTIIESQPLFSLSKGVRVYVEPSAAEVFTQPFRVHVEPDGGDVFSPIVGVDVSPP